MRDVKHKKYWIHKKYQMYKLLHDPDHHKYMHISTQLNVLKIIIIVW